MKYIKTYEDIFDNSKYKKYIITKYKRYKSDNSEDIYINLYENLYYTMNKNSFRALYYYEEFTNKIEEFINRQEIDYIPINFIVYESDILENSIEELDEIIKLHLETKKLNVAIKKYNL
jgi:hypothetical protein